MPDYELFYFDVSGRAGVARLLFELAGVQFKDTKYAFQEWGAHKNDRKRFPLNQMPVLRVGDDHIAESAAINEFLANEFDLHGNNNLERARVTMVTNASASLLQLWFEFAFKQDKAAAEQERAKLFGEQAPHTLSCLEDILKQKEEGKKYFLGAKITLADVVFFDTILCLESSDASVLDKFPLLNDLKQRMLAMPAIAKHIPTRKLAL